MQSDFNSSIKPAGRVLVCTNEIVFQNLYQVDTGEILTELTNETFMVMRNRKDYSANIQIERDFIEKNTGPGLLFIDITGGLQTTQSDMIGVLVSKAKLFRVEAQEMIKDMEQYNLGAILPPETVTAMKLAFGKQMETIIDTTLAGYIRFIAQKWGKDIDIHAEDLHFSQNTEVIYDITI